MRGWFGFAGAVGARRGVPGRGMACPYSVSILALSFVCAVAGANSVLDRGIELFAKEDYKAAQKSFEDAVASDPDNADHLLWLGRAYGRRAERSTGLAALGAFSLARKCRESFEQAIAQDPKHLGALQALFDYYLNAPGIVGGGDDKAAALIPKMRAVSPATALRARASLLEKQEKFPEAEAALREAVALEPGEIGHRLSLASFLSRRGWYDQSDKLFAEAQAEKPDSPDVWYARAKALIRAKRNPAEARRLLERYLRTPLQAPDAEPYSNAHKLLDEL